jgi:hypothetical protein
VFHVIALHVKPEPQLEAAARDYGPRLAKGEPRRCKRCRRPIPATSRRHECARCTVAAARGLAAEGACAVCGNADLRVLGVAELADGRAVICANDGAVLGKLALTLDELRAEVRRGDADAGGLLDELLLELDGSTADAAAA